MVAIDTVHYVVCFHPRNAGAADILFLAQDDHEFETTLNPAKARVFTDHESAQEHSRLLRAASLARFRDFDIGFGYHSVAMSHDFHISHFWWWST